MALVALARGRDASDCGPEPDPDSGTKHNQARRSLALWLTSLAGAPRGHQQCCALEPPARYQAPSSSSHRNLTAVDGLVPRRRLDARAFSANSPRRDHSPTRPRLPPPSFCPPAHSPASHSPSPLPPPRGPHHLPHTPNSLSIRSPVPSCPLERLPRRPAAPHSTPAPASALARSPRLHVRWRPA